MSDKEQHVWKKNAQSEFNRWAETYDKSVLNHLLFHRCYLKFIELILRYYPDPKTPLCLLDVGCGTGTFASMLGATELPVKPMGLDMAERMCQLAKEKSIQAGLDHKVTFITGDSEHLPFPDNTVDIVTCSNSFHHYPHQQVVLDEFYRILRPGGRVIVLDGYRDNFIGWLIFDVGVTFMEKSVHHCPAASIRNMFLKSQYAEVYQEKFGFWCPVLATVGTKL